MGSSRRENVSWSSVRLERSVCLWFGGVVRTFLVAVLPVPEDDLAHPGQRVTEGEERGGKQALHLHTLCVSLLGQEGVGRLAEAQRR